MNNFNDSEQILKKKFQNLNPTLVFNYKKIHKYKSLKFINLHFGSITKIKILAVASD